MIINSQFYICQYNGKEPLPLMSMPESINIDPFKRAEYNKFIQSIDSIYSAQDIDGDIPKFWTTRIQEINDLGNISYIYSPHPESTLQNLSSSSSYYFILRDSSLVPIKIPVVGGEITGFSDVSSLPIIDGISSCKGIVKDCQEQVSTEPSVQQTESLNTCCRSVSASGNNLVDIIFSLSNLRPLESYVYTVESVGANWPVNINPLSGVFKPSKTHGQIKIDALFCPGTGHCGNNILSHSVDSDCLLRDNTIKYANIQLSLKPSGYSNSNFTINSDHYSLTCEGCLPRLPSARLTNTIGVQQDSITINENSFDGFAYDEFTLEISEPALLYRDKVYTYSIETLEAEYPIIYVSPTGGILTLREGTNRNIANIKFFFCPSTGLCIPGNNGVPNYSIPSYPKFLSGEDSLTSVVKIKIRASIEYYDCPGQKVYSNTRVISFIR